MLRKVVSVEVRQVEFQRAGRFGFMEKKYPQKSEGVGKGREAYPRIHINCLHFTGRILTQIQNESLKHNWLVFLSSEAFQNFTLLVKIMLECNKHYLLNNLRLSTLSESTLSVCCYSPVTRVGFHFSATHLHGTLYITIFCSFNLNL